jgi:zinc protease
MRTALRDAADQAGTRTSANLADQTWSMWRQDQVLTTPASMLERFEASLDDVTVEAVNAAFREQWEGVEPLLYLASPMELENPEDEIRQVWTESREQPVEAPEDSGATEFAYGDFGPAGEVVSREEIEDLGLVRFQFENGVAVTFKQTDFEDGSIRVRLDFGRGELEPRALDGVDIISGSVFTSAGLGEHSEDELGRVLAGRNIGYGFGVGDDSFSFQATTTPSDLRVQFDLLTAFLTDPGWRQEGLDQFRHPGNPPQSLFLAVRRAAGGCHADDPGRRSALWPARSRTGCRHRHGRRPGFPGAGPGGSTHRGDCRWRCVRGGSRRGARPDAGRAAATRGELAGL